VAAKKTSTERQAPTGTPPSITFSSPRTAGSMLTAGLCVGSACERVFITVCHISLPCIEQTTGMTIHGQFPWTVDSHGEGTRQGDGSFTWKSSTTGFRMGLPIQTKSLQGSSSADEKAAVSPLTTIQRPASWGRLHGRLRPAMT